MVKTKKMVLCLALLVMAIIPAFAQQQYNDEKEFRARPIDGGKGVEIIEYIGDKWEVRIPPRIQNLPVTRIGNGENKAFDDSLINIIIPDSVTSIGDSAFFLCKNLTSITLPDGVTSIGNEAFGGCENLTNITIPNGVTSIGDRAFIYCENLTNITIPNGVTSIGDRAFFLCKNLTSITIPASVKTIGRDTFGSCINLTSVTFQGTISSSSLDSGAFGYNYEPDFDNSSKNYIYSYSHYSSIGDLRDKFYARNKANGTPGTYKRQKGSDKWTKQ